MMGSEANYYSRQQTETSLLATRKLDENSKISNKIGGQIYETFSSNGRPVQEKHQTSRRRRDSTKRLSQKFTLVYR